MRNSSFSQKIYSYLVSTYEWYLHTSERSLDEAYNAALQIKSIEEQYFDGKKIDLESVIYGNSVIDYFETELKKLLKIVRMRLTEFRASAYFLNSANQKPNHAVETESKLSPLFLEKLKFIDEVVTKYNIPNYQQPPAPVLQSSQIVKVEQPGTVPPPATIEDLEKRRYKIDTTGVLPRSILSTLSRLQVELDPNSEQDVVRNFRKSQRRTITAIRFILLIIIVPLLTYQVSKGLIVGPIVDNFKEENQVALFLNVEMEEKAMIELQRFEERIKFEDLISDAIELTPEDIEIQVKHKAREIAEEFRGESANAIKNIFSDLLSVGAFIWLLVVSKREIAVLKDFFDNVVYGLSDSAKAFIIILFTDMFVGFHSPHGWEVILAWIAEHFGLPENKAFIYLFIATFPVILDTIFKYWIFRYLNRVSPSAVATYRNMNE